MKSLFMTAAVVTAAIALGGCPGKRQKPVAPPPPAATATASVKFHGSRGPSKRLFREEPATSASRCFTTEHPGAATIAAVGPVAQRLVQGTHRQGAFARKRAKWTG